MLILTQIVIIRNDSSVDKNRDVVVAYLKGELAKNHMSSPFTFEEMEKICRSHLYCSPMIIVTQEQGTNKVPKKRVCQHLSKGNMVTGTLSVNSFIDKEDFPTRFNFPVDVANSVSTLIKSFTPSYPFHGPEALGCGIVVASVAVAYCCGILWHYLLWHPFWHCCGIHLWHHIPSILTCKPQISHALPGTQVCTFDIKAFYRTCPVLPDHKPFLVVQFDSQFLLDHCYPFGTHPVSSNTGQICCAVVDIWNAETVVDADIKGYEDNLSSLQFPNVDGPFHEGTHQY
jgi:hypothetical protein